jgi:hypothetical protein
MACPEEILASASPWHYFELRDVEEDVEDTESGSDDVAESNVDSDAASDDELDRVLADLCGTALRCWIISTEISISSRKMRTMSSISGLRSMPMVTRLRAVPQSCCSLCKESMNGRI